MKVTAVYSAPPTPTPEPTASSSPSPNPTAAPTAIPTANPTPTSTPRPTQQPTSTPTPTNPPLKETATIQLSCSNTHSAQGFKVQILGSLESGSQTPLDQPIKLYYSSNNGESWDSLTTVITDAQSQFSAVWLPSASGFYVIKADWDGNANFNSATALVNFIISPDVESNIFTVASNSTITEFAFNSTTRQLSFQATGPTGTKGYVQITLAKSLIPDLSELKVFVDEKQVTFSSQAVDDYYVLALAYSHSTHNIRVDLAQETNPSESALPTWVIYAAPIIVVIVAIVGIGLWIKRKKTT